MTHSYFKDKNDPVFDSGLKLRTDKPTLFVSERVDKIIQALAYKMSEEFALYCTVKQRGWNFLIEDYMIPRQRVSSAHVEVDQAPPTAQHRCFIHRHPDSCNSFSVDDNTTINVNNDISILFTEKDGYVRGQLNLKHDDERLVIDCDVVVRMSLPSIKTVEKKIKNLHEENKKIRERQERREEKKRKRMEKRMKKKQKWEKVDTYLVADEDYGNYKKPEIIGNENPRCETIYQIPLTHDGLDFLSDDDSIHEDIKPQMQPVSYYDWTDAMTDQIPLGTLNELEKNTEKILTLFPVVPDGFNEFYQDITDDLKVDFYDDWCFFIWDVARTLMLTYGEKERCIPKIETLRDRWNEKTFNTAFAIAISYQRMLLGSEAAGYAKEQLTKLEGDKKDA